MGGIESRKVCKDGSADRKKRNRNMLEKEEEIIIGAKSLKRQEAIIAITKMEG